MNCENHDLTHGASGPFPTTGRRRGRRWLRALRPALGVLLLGLWAAACGTTPSGPPPVPQLASRALGSSFVAVTGTGFPVSAPAVLTGTTPQGTTTVEVKTDRRGEIATSVPVPDGFQGKLDVKATVGAATATATTDAGTGPGEEPADDAGVRQPAKVDCTETGDVGDVPPASPGDVVCLTGETSSRLTIQTGGTAAAPITYSGGGDATAAGIDVTADNVIVEGFTSKEGKNQGARLEGDNITFRDNTVDHPLFGGDDTDGLRFFGDDITILHNTITDVSDGSDCGDDGCGDGPHPDCMQTFYSQTYPTSSNVTIEGNRCDDIASQCLIGEGPQLPDEGINGPGEGTGWIFYDNYCNTGAAQALQFKDVTNVTVADDFFDGKNNKAISLSDGSTGTHVGGNKLGPKTAKLITFDDPTVSAGYIGPNPDA